MSYNKKNKINGIYIFYKCRIKLDFFPLPKKGGRSQTMQMQHIGLLWQYDMAY